MSLFSQLKTVQGQQWLVVDKVRVPDIEKLAYLYIPNVEVVQLFKGTPFEHLNEIGPVAIKYTAVKEFEDLLLNDFALTTSSVLFTVNDTKDNEELIQHLQALHYVVKNDSPIFFRYYTNSLWDEICDDLNEKDIVTLLGPFTHISWISKNKTVNNIENKNKTKELKLPYQLTSDIFNKLV